MCEVLESVAMLNETNARIYKLALGGNKFAVRIFVLILLQAYEICSARKYSVFATHKFAARIINLLRRAVKRSTWQIY